MCWVRLSVCSSVQTPKIFSTGKKNVFERPETYDWPSEGSHLAMSMCSVWSLSWGPPSAYCAEGLHSRCFLYLVVMFRCTGGFRWSANLQVRALFETCSRRPFDAGSNFKISLSCHLEPRKIKRYFADSVHRRSGKDSEKLRDSCLMQFHHWPTAVLKAVTALEFPVQDIIWCRVGFGKKFCFSSPRRRWMLFLEASRNPDDPGVDVSGPQTRLGLGLNSNPMPFGVTRRVTRRHVKNEKNPRMAKVCAFFGRREAKILVVTVVNATPIYDK